jgi:hypothetical protein
MEASVNCRMVTNVLAEDVESNFALNIQSSTAQLLWSDVWPGSQHGWPPKTPTRPPVGGTSWSQMRWICLGSQNHSQYDCRSSRTASQTVSKNACIEVCSSSPVCDRVRSNTQNYLHWRVSQSLRIPPRRAVEDRKITLPMNRTDDNVLRRSC